MVPKVLQNIRKKVFDQFDALGGWKKKLAYKAYHTKLENYRKYGIITHAIYDKIIFKRIILNNSKRRLSSFLKAIFFRINFCIFIIKASLIL